MEVLSFKTVIWEYIYNKATAKEFLLIRLNIIAKGDNLESAYEAWQSFRKSMH